MSGPAPSPLVAVLGTTGAGKTTFITKATGCTNLKIGHGLESCTQEMQLAQVNIDGQNVMLIDTPGFDDTNRSDTEILGMIAKHLSITYEAGQLLNGLIVLQSVTANRVQGNEKRQMRLLEAVIGPKNFGNIIIATTHWSDLKSEEAAEGRVQERVENTNFWGTMISKGARVVKHEDTEASALNIVKMASFKPKVTLDLQAELKANGGNVRMTSAGQYMDQDLNDRFKKVLEELTEARQAISSFTASAASMKEEIAELNAKLQKIQDEKEALDSAKVSAAGGKDQYLTIQQMEMTPQVSAGDKDDEWDVWNWCFVCCCPLPACVYYSFKSVSRVAQAFDKLGEWCKEEYEEYGETVGGIAALTALVVACVVM